MTSPPLGVVHHGGGCVVVDLHSHLVHGEVYPTVMMEITLPVVQVMVERRLVLADTLPARDT